MGVCIAGPFVILLSISNEESLSFPYQHMSESRKIKVLFHLIPKEEVCLMADSKDVTDSMSYRQLNPICVNRDHLEVHLDLKFS